MVIDLFSKARTLPPLLPVPLVRANRMFADTLAQMMTLQINALKSYLNMGLNQMRAAAEITDVQSFQDFCRRQAHIAQTMQYKVLHDMKALSQINARFQNEVHTLNQSALQDVFFKAA